MFVVEDEEEKNHFIFTPEEAKYLDDVWRRHRIKEIYQRVFTVGERLHDSDLQELAALGDEQAVKLVQAENTIQKLRLEYLSQVGNI